MNKSQRFKNAVTPVFDILQSMPPFAYLVPIVVQYGVSNVTAMIATALFAVPPVARCIALVLKNDSRGVLEAGRMWGFQSWPLVLPVQMQPRYSLIVCGLVRKRCV